MNTRRNTIAIAVLLVAAFTGSVLSLNGVEAARGRQATLEEILYIPSAKALKRMGLGYSGVLADIYWTRAVQYYGQKLATRRPDLRYDLLYPLLDITTDLDPHLIVVYEFGSVFLSQRPPVGAGQPDKAVALLEKGIRNNPDYWRLYFDLGCIQYFDRKDYKAAQEAFEKGSENPKSLIWMKTMAASMAERANDPETALNLWTRLYETASDEMVKQNAVQHIEGLRADHEVLELEQRVKMYQQRTGRLPSNWYEMMHEGLLAQVPMDPVDKPYKLMPDGIVQVEDPDSIPFLTKGIPPGWKKSTKP
jgi:tetratricopeptide (TPR) repeat protein